MSFSEYSGSKTKVSHTVTRILRSAQDNLPKPQGSSVGALIKSLSNGGNRSGSERLNKYTSPQNTTLSKFGFQKLRLGLDKKRSYSNHHSELLDNQDGGDEGSGEEDDADMHNQFGNANLSNAALIGQERGSTRNSKQKRWPF